MGICTQTGIHIQIGIFKLVFSHLLSHIGDEKLVDKFPGQNK